jgi:hypothetical protein
MGRLEITAAACSIRYGQADEGPAGQRLHTAGTFRLANGRDSFQIFGEQFPELRYDSLR